MQFRDLYPGPRRCRRYYSSRRYFHARVCPSLSISEIPELPAMQPARLEQLRSKLQAQPDLSYRVPFRLSVARQTIDLRYSPQLRRPMARACWTWALNQKPSSFRDSVNIVHATEAPSSFAKNAKEGWGNCTLNSFSLLQSALSDELAPTNSASRPCPPRGSLHSTETRWESSLSTFRLFRPSEQCSIPASWR